MLVLMWLRLVGVAIFAAGMGGLAASVVVTISSGGASSGWVSSLPGFGFTLAAVCIPAAAAAAWLMPSRADLLSAASRTDGTPMPVLMLLAFLGVVAAALVPGLRQWWAEDRELLRLAGLDPTGAFGINWLPAMLLLALPGIAGATLATYGATSLLATSVHRGLIVRVLAACVVLQAGLVAVDVLVLQQMQAGGAAMLVWCLVNELT